MEPNLNPPKPAGAKAPGEKGPPVGLGKLPPHGQGRSLLAVLGRKVPGRPEDRPAPKKTLGQRPPTASLIWEEQDLENRWGLCKGGRYTSVNKLFTFAIAAVVTAGFLGLLFLLRGSTPALRWLIEPFIRQGNLYTTGPATFLFFWGLVVLVFKASKIRFQRRALDLAAVPQSQEFFLNEGTARTVLERMRGLVDGVQYFILLNRIDRALSNLQNIGGVSDVSTILSSQAENDENMIASSYALINGIVWAIPVLGFLGTVQGLSVAISRFTTALQVTGGATGAGLDSIKTELQKVTAGLSTAFETTLVALVFALVVQLLSNFMQQKETDFLDECNDYCHAHVVSKLRLAGKTVGAPTFLSAPAQSAPHADRNVGAPT